MLAPEVWNFPSPKVIISHKKNQDLQSINTFVNMNGFYKSLIVTCPDMVPTPNYIQDTVTEDSDYYKLTDCSLTEFVEPMFIESFVKKGTLYCLTANRNCIVQNCAAITPDGFLTIHILDYIYQTLGLDGTKRPHNFCEVRIPLKSIKNYKRIKLELSKLELFDFYVNWEPNNDDVCPSSIAKYFNDKSIHVSVHSLRIRNLSPIITEIPSLEDVDIDEMVEWLGLLAHDADLTPTESYISTYSQPESKNSIKSSRISVYIAEGFIMPSLINKISEKLSEIVKSRELDNLWASMSVQSNENSLFQWKTSSPRMFQAHDSSCNLFFTHNGHDIIYSIGQLKYS